MGIRNRYFLCRCSRNCFFIIIITNLVIVVVVIFQKCQVMVTSLSCCWYSGGHPPESQLLGVPAIGGAGKMESDRGIDTGYEWDMPR